MKLSRQKAHARVEMLPLLDIVFLLLVFFIYAMLTMSVNRALPISLPSSSSAEIIKQEAKSLVVKADGSLFLDKILITPDELQATLKILLSQNLEEELTVKVFADSALSYQELYQVLDLLKEAGVNVISLQASSKKPDKPKDASPANEQDLP